MKMRTGRTSRITTQTYHFTGFHQLIFFYQLLGQVSVNSLQTIVVTNNDILAITSTLIFHDTYLTIKGSHDSIADINLQVKTVVHSSPTGTERRSYLCTRSRHMESGQVDCISFGNNSVSVSMYILVIPVRIKTKGRIFGLFGTDLLLQGQRVY